MEDPSDGSRRGLIAALMVVAALVVGGIWLERHISAMDAIQDCVMAGRHNCAPVTPAPG